VTIDIVAMLFDQIFGDPRVPEALKALIGRLQIPVVKVAVLDKKFFSKKAHPARRMLDTLGEFALGLDETFDATSPLYKHIEGIIARLLEPVRRRVEVFETLHNELLEVIRARTSARKTRPRRWRARSPTRSAWKSARRLRTRDQEPRAGHQDAAAGAEVPRRRMGQAAAADLRAPRSGRRRVEERAGYHGSSDLERDLQALGRRSTQARASAPGLLKRLQAGLQSTGSAEDKRKQFFTKLMRLHTKAMTVPKRRRSRPRYPR
jgi:hypothetical protein